MTPAEISFSGRAGALNDRSRVEMSFSDTDGRPNMQVSVASDNTLRITNKSTSPDAGEKGKAAIEIPLNKGSGEIALPLQENIGRVDVLQSTSSTQLRLYPVDDRGTIAEKNVIVYETCTGSLFME